MRTPRFIRPHSITIVNYEPTETDNKRNSHETTLNHVKVQGAKKDSKSKELNYPDDSIKIIIDCSDIDKPFEPFTAWDASITGDSWTVHPQSDQVIFNGETLNIESFDVINPFGNDPEFVELTCLRS